MQKKSVISHCESHDALIKNKAIESQITDCLVVTQRTQQPKTQQTTNVFGTHFWSSFADIYETTTETTTHLAGIARELLNNTHVVRCYITGKNYPALNFSGVAIFVDASTIEYCAVGEFSPSGIIDNWSGRIAFEVKNGGQVADNNVSLDSNKAGEGVPGKSVSAALWTQRYFEHTLGWDFESVWRWDTQENRPALRAVGVQAAPAEAQRARFREQAAAAEAAFTEALKNHLWL